MAPTPADLDIGILDESGQQMPIMPEEQEEQGWHGQGKSLIKTEMTSVKQSGTLESASGQIFQPPAWCYGWAYQPPGQAYTSAGAAGRDSSLFSSVQSLYVAEL